MQVNNIAITKSPAAADRTRLQAEVVPDTDAVPTEVYWFDVPDRYSDYLSDSGNPWLACLAPFAANLGEPLRITRPVDALLYQGVQELMRVWRLWYPDRRLRVVPIEADVLEPGSAAPGPDRTGAFFSSGVDAWFTLLRHTEAPTVRQPISITDLLTVWGFDILVDDPGAFVPMREVQERAAARFGLEPIVIATNLRQTAWWEGADWGLMGNGAALAAIGLALERKLTRVMVPSSHSYADPLFWGSHPLTDPLLSTNRTRIIHDGSAYTRAEKTELIAGFDAAMESLQVCWQTKSFTNCEHCSKCYRTMTTLWLAGALERCQTFTRSTVDVKKIARIVSGDESGRALIGEVRAFALEKGRPDVARAIDRSLGYSRRIEWVRGRLKPLHQMRLIWRLARFLENRLLSNAIYP